MNWDMVITGVLSLLGGGFLNKLWEEHRKTKTTVSADKRVDRSEEFAQERQKRSDEVAGLHGVIEQLKEMISDVKADSKAKIAAQDVEIGRLRDSEQTCRAENATLSGRLLLVEGRERDKNKRIYRLERRLIKLTGDTGSWEEKEGSDQHGKPTKNDSKDADKEGDHAPDSVG